MLQELLARILMEAAMVIAATAIAQLLRWLARQSTTVEVAVRGGRATG